MAAPPVGDVLLPASSAAPTVATKGGGAAAAAASAPKPPALQSAMYFVTEATALAKPEVGSSLEDAVFIAKHAVGLADGVGGWASKGVDAGAYARKLMDNAHARATMAVDRAGAGGRIEIDPYKLVEYAVNNTKLPGSSTAVVATVGTAGTLQLYNVGDSVGMVWRHGAKHAGQWSLQMRTKVQSEDGCPEQVMYQTRSYATVGAKGDAHRFTPSPDDLRTWYRGGGGGCASAPTPIPHTPPTPLPLLSCHSSACPQQKQHSLSGRNSATHKSQRR